MGMSPYIKRLRQHIGHDLLLMPSVSALIFNDKGELLLHRSSDDGKWYIIGGAMDPGETSADACVREVREETGLTVTPERLVGVYTSPTVTYPNSNRSSTSAPPSSAKCSRAISTSRTMNRWNSAISRSKLCRNCGRIIG